MLRLERLSQLSRRSAGQRRRDRHFTLRRVRLSLEALEDRLVPSATITDLGVLGSDSTSSAVAINASGQVVGTSSPAISSNNPSLAFHPFLYSGGQTTALPTLGGSLGAKPLAINASGQVLLQSFGNLSIDTFLYDANGAGNGKPTTTDLVTKFGGFLSVNALNDNGLVAGIDVSNIATPQAAVGNLSNGKITDLGVLPGDNYSAAAAINNAGEVAGISANIPANASTQTNIVPHAFLYEGKSDNKGNPILVPLGTLTGGTGSAPLAINASGEVVGAADIAGGAYHAFLFNPNAANNPMTDLGTLNGNKYSEAVAVNDQGEVVGMSGNTLNSSVGLVNAEPFLYRNGSMIDLNSLLPQGSGWQLTSVAGINDADQIVGTGTINGQSHAFLLNLNDQATNPPPNNPQPPANHSQPPTQPSQAPNPLGQLQALETSLLNQFQQVESELNVLNTQLSMEMTALIHEVVVLEQQIL